MKELKIGLLIITCLFLAVSCGSEKETGNQTGTAAEETAEEKGLNLKFDGEEVNLEAKSTWLNQSGDRFNNNEDTASKTIIVIANYDLTTKYGYASVTNSIKSDGQIRVDMSYIGEKGTDNESPFKAGKYNISEDDPFNAFEKASVYHFADGKEKEVKLKYGQVKGFIEITEITKDEKTGETIVSGKVDLTDGENSIKGTFTAQEDKNSI